MSFSTARAQNACGMALTLLRHGASQAQLKS